MIDVATLSVIRRWALREHLSLREIARRAGLSRNTIKKYLRADTVEPRYAKRVSPSKLDPFADKLSGWLKTEAGKSRKQRRTVKQMHADLAALGYDGSYNRVAAFARVWQAKRQEAERTTGRGTFVPLTFGAGEAFQFDWSEDWAVIGGERTKLQVAHTKLSHSRTCTKRLWSPTASQLPDTPAQLAAQQGPQGHPIRVPDLCGDLVDAGVPGAQEMDGMLHAQVLEIRQRCLSQNALQPPRQGALACARGAGRLGQREPLREPTSGPALEALHHRVGMRKVVGNHELGLRTACLDQQIACHQGRQRRTAPSDDAQGQVDVGQSGTRGGEACRVHDHA